MKENEDSGEGLVVDDEILKLLKEAMKEQIREKRVLPNKTMLNNALKDTVTEFLECFTLIGYDLKGNVVDMTLYKTKMEKAALDNLFVQKFGEFMASRYNVEDI